MVLKFITLILYAVISAVCLWWRV